MAPDNSFKPTPLGDRAWFRCWVLLEKSVSSSKPVLSARFYAILFFVGVGTFFIHEFAHWITGIVLGHDMVATPNHVWSRNPMNTWDQAMVSAAGPLVTIAQGIAGFWLVKRWRSRLGFALLYMAFFMRLLACFMSLFNPNDEARISQLLGLGTLTLPLMVVMGLFALVVSASRELGIRFRDQFFCYLVASIVVTLIVGVDSMVWRKA